jgi:tetratricopeptide (TPR) repeat protein
MLRAFSRSALCLSILLAPSLRALAAQGPSSTAELLASADEAWRARRYDDAFERYALVLSRDSTSTRAVFRTATLLAWRNDLDHSIALFRQYVRLAPGDDDGRIGLARALAWRGRYQEALAITDSIVVANPRQRDAALLAAQTLAWSGRLQDAIGRYRAWLSTHDNDAEAWTALAQTWRWAGRPDETRQAVEHALNIDPRNDGARAQLEWASAALAPSLEPTVTNTNDSDDNRSTLYGVRGGIAAPWGARIILDGSYRVADLEARHGTAATLRAGSSWSPVDGRWTVRADLGATQLDASDGTVAAKVTRIEPIVAARVSGRVAPRFALGAGVTRAAFDETASLILAGVASTSVEGDADLALRPTLSLGGGGGWTRLTGGSAPNSRVAGSTTLRWSFSRIASVAAGVRGFAYDHAAFDGYFAPKRYLLAEVSARVRIGEERGWGLESDLGLGSQTITAFDDSRTGRFAQRLSATVAYRRAEGIEWGIGGGFANVASPTTISSADYRAYSILIKGRWRL